MTSPPPSNHPEPLQLAQRIIELNAAMHREVDARRYQEAASIRDQRVLLEDELKRSSDDLLIRNVRIAMDDSLSRHPLLDMFLVNSDEFDASVFSILATAPLPLRWIIHGCGNPPIGTLKRRLRTDSLDSEYFRASFPVISYKMMSPSTHIRERIDALSRETDRSPTPVIWVCNDLYWLESKGVFADLVARFEDPSSEFIACVGPQDDDVTPRICNLHGVTRLLFNAPDDDKPTP